jgi:hypothetical protein
MSASENGKENDALATPVLGSLEEHSDKSAAPQPAATPFTVFTEREKWIVVNLAAFGSLFRCVRLTLTATMAR